MSLGQDIYLSPDPKSKEWLSKDEIQSKLSKSSPDGLIGLKLAKYPLRTRSKVVKSAVCKALGYPVPNNFQKTKPRFPVQDLDVYSQKANNLQIWNQEIDPNRRYAIIRLDEGSVVKAVRVVTGAELIPLDTTGKLTIKYQAAYRKPFESSLLLSGDTSLLRKWISPSLSAVADDSDAEDIPKRGTVLPIEGVYKLLQKLVGSKIEFEGLDQERLRGAELHSYVCSALGYGEYSDSGTFPDVPNQLLEVKLQTSPTIDLGLVLPNSTGLIGDMEELGIRHCDVRYAVFYGRKIGMKVQLDYLLLCNGQEFFNHFSQFEGKEINSKIQIPLPKDFFNK